MGLDFINTFHGDSPWAKN
uniref:Uncharacterized protein n=1 Tax=Rhizophora mucronata TaxID=61149 RepID=A0A2P2PK68_RHIMU